MRRATTAATTNGDARRRRRRRRRRAEGARSSPPATDRSRRTRGSPPSSGRCAPRSSAPRGRTEQPQRRALDRHRRRQTPVRRRAAADAGQALHEVRTRLRREDIPAPGGGALPGGDREARGGAAGTRAEDERRKEKRRSGDDPAAGAMSLRAVRDAVTRRCGVREAWYAVFAKLAREGYTVRRFDSPWCQPTRGGFGGDHAAFAGSGPLAGGFATNDPLRAKRKETPLQPPPRLPEEEPTVGNVRKEDEPTAVPAANGWWVDASTWTGARRRNRSPRSAPRCTRRSRCFRCTLPTGTSANGILTTCCSSCSTRTCRPTRTRCGGGGGDRERVPRGAGAYIGSEKRYSRRRRPREKMVYAHVSDSTVMMYRMDVPASRAPEVGRGAAEPLVVMSVLS